MAQASGFPAIIPLLFHTFPLYPPHTLQPLPMPSTAILLNSSMLHEPLTTQPPLYRTVKPRITITQLTDHFNISNTSLFQVVTLSQPSHYHDQHTQLFYIHAYISLQYHTHTTLTHTIQLTYAINYYSYHNQLYHIIGHFIPNHTKHAHSST